MAQKHIILVCGEASGELHAANLAKAIKQIAPDVKISAVGGALLRNAGAEVFYDIKDLSVIGLFDALKKLPKFFSLKNIILRKIRSDRPDAVILVDFSGFNLRLVKEIGKGIPAIYYISPQVWASRAGRIKTIKTHISKMIVLFTFEVEFYKKYGIDADFTGHPLLDIVKPTMGKKDFLKRLDLSDAKTTIALLPGSRRQEIERILPVMLEASVYIHRDIPDTQFVIAKSPHVDLHIYHRIISGLTLGVKIIEGNTYDCMNIADFCLVCSGTATLETAIMQRPLAVIYKTSLLNYLLYRPQIKVPFIGMVNIVAGKKIVPEFIQFQATAAHISEEVIKTLKHPAEMERIKNDLSGVKSSLGENGASLRAARIIVDFLNKPGA
jgi:lipid-A-disaccharide synthase